MGNWQTALGAALVAGSNMAGRNRLEKIEETKRNEDRDFRNLQAALMKEDQELQRKREGRDASSFKTSQADAIRARLGVGGEPTDAELQTIIEAGQEGSLSAAPSAVPAEVIPDGINATSVSAEMPAGRRTLVPNYEQQQTIAKNADEAKLRGGVVSESDAKTRARAAVSSPAFEKSPFTTQQAVWQLAFGSNMPETPEQRKAELLLQAGIRQKELEVMYPPDRFGADRGFAPGKQPDLQTAWDADYHKTVSAITYGPANQQQPQTADAIARAAFASVTSRRGARPTATVAAPAVDPNFVGPVPPVPSVAPAAAKRTTSVIFRK